MQKATILYVRHAWTRRRGSKLHSSLALSEPKGHQTTRKHGVPPNNGSELHLCQKYGQHRLWGGVHHNLLQGYNSASVNMLC